MSPPDDVVVVLPGRREDVPAILAIYNHYVLTSAISFDLEPQTIEARLEWFSHYAGTGRYRLFVAHRGGEIVGFACSSRFRPRAAYETSVEVSVYVREGSHGRGIGARLYEALFAALAGEDVHRAYAGIALPNPASVALHERFGFRHVGVLTEVGRKLGRYWDVEYMEKRFDRQPGA